MPDEHFTCDACKGIFAKNWTDEEAQAEYESVPEWQGLQQAVLCEDCYRQMLTWAESVGLPVPSDG